MRAWWVLTAGLAVLGAARGSQADERPSGKEQRFVSEREARGPDVVPAPSKTGSPMQVSDQQRRPVPLLAPPSPPSTERGATDLEWIRNWVIDVVNDSTGRGSDIYNQGAHLHSYLYFQATLLSLLHYLPQFKNEKLTKRVQNALSRATEVRTDWEAALVLRTALNDIRNRIGKDEGGENGLSLWDRLGGEETVRAIVRATFDEAAKDPKVNLTRNGDYPYTPTRAERLEEGGVEVIRALSLQKEKPQHPAKHSGRNMETVHQGMRITTTEFNAARKHLVTALRYYCVPEEDILELLKYVDDERKNIVGK